MQTAARDEPEGVNKDSTNAGKKSENSTAEAAEKNGLDRKAKSINQRMNEWTD